MDEENEFVMLSNSFESSLLIDDDDFVWISRGNQVSCSSGIHLHNNQEENYEKLGPSVDTVKENNKGHIKSGSTILTDFDDEFSYEQFESAISTKKVSNKHKKYNAHQRLRQRQVTFFKTLRSGYNESSYSTLNTFDKPTTDILKSIVSGNNYNWGYFGDVLKKGPKSVVLYAWIYSKRYPVWEPGAKPDLVYAFINNIFNKRYRNWQLAVKAVKIYKLTDNALKNEQVFQKVQLEKEHLLLLNKAKLNVPEVMRCSRNVIVTSIIGNEDKIAPSIVSVPLSLKHNKEMYNNIVNEMAMWYNTLHLVHGKLSCRNILYWKEQLYYIGWSHSVRWDHPLALKKLMRDCHFITKFFEKRDIRVKTTERLFQDITGRNKIDASVLRVIHRRPDVWKNLQLSNPNRKGLDSCNLDRNCRFKS